MYACITKEGFPKVVTGFGIKTLLNQSACVHHAKARREMRAELKKWPD
jgi:hypothetical protein